MAIEAVRPPRRVVVNGVRVCRECGLPKMEGRRPEAGKCLDCASRRTTSRRWREGRHDSINA